MKSPENVNDEDRCSACPPKEGETEEGEPLLKPLRGYDLYLYHKRVVDKEAAEG